MVASARMSALAFTPDKPGGARLAVHLIHHPLSARKFIVPVVAALRFAGVDAELWTEPSALRDPLLAASGVPLQGAVCNLQGSPMRMALGWWRLLAALRRRGPRVVHAHQTRSALLPLAAAAVAGVPVRIYHNHGLPYLGHHGLVRWGLWLCERLNGALATQVLLVSPSNLRCAVADALFAGTSARVLGAGSICGVDLDEYPEPTAQKRLAARRARALPEHGFVLGWVGRPHRRKGLPLVLAAWKAAGCAEQGGTLLLAGSSQAQAESLCGALPAGVQALGLVQDMPEFYRACDAVALLSAHEGFSYALLEAAASGCALLGSDIPGIRDSIIPGHSGLLVARTLTAVSQAIAQLASDPLACRALGVAARARAVAQFDRRRVIGELCRFYREDLGMGEAP
jgi:N,N'-diacetylbacillosaminyl-diphospho-undecaprenol alpha-1,3-N-acetylgalactosaminyltransferase